LIEFAMLDQFEREYTPESFSKEILIVVHGDKDGSAYTGKSGSALGEALGETVDEDSFEFVPVADLRGVPSFVRGWVKKQFSTNKEEWVLLDWDSAFTNAYGLEKGKCNLIVFDRDRKLAVHRPVTETDPVVVDELVKHIRALLTKTE
jgi:hypothetical protein